MHGLINECPRSPMWAYSAARSASSLTATMKSQQDQLQAIVGDLDVLHKQVDGKVETFTGHHDVVNQDGSLIETVEPYSDWVTPDTRIEHTGDTYVKLEVVNGKDAIASMWAFSYDVDQNTFAWTLIDNTLAAEAYTSALEAGALADGKINCFYQEILSLLLHKIQP